MSFVAKILHSTLPVSVVVEDNGKVAYAYWLDGAAITGDVWLYNCIASPAAPEWTDPEKMPFLNPANYSKEGGFSPLRKDDEVSVRWSDDGKRAVIYLRQQEFAIVGSHIRPGWCWLAKKDGPLANVLTADTPKS